ncbi:MAG: ABC transporter permease [Promethearchaeota archaeon]|nr:MAG: ABC transporter permease [Candidatus Lokiarchaeota archaeon]
MKLSALIKKEFGRIRSEKRTLFLLFFIPIVLIVIFGLTTGGSPTKFFNAAIITKDNIPTYGDFPANSSQYDETFISVFSEGLSSFGFHGSYNVTNETQYLETKQYCIALLRDEIIDIFIVLAPNFSESIQRSIENNTNSQISYFIDGSDKEAINAVEISLQEPIGIFRQNIGMSGNFTTLIPYLEYEVPFWEKQALNYAFALIIPLIIIGTTMNFSCLSIVADEPLPRMLITPTSKSSIILSKLIANSLIMVLQAGEIFISTALFGLYALGDLFQLFLILIGIGLAGISMGLFVSALSGTEQQANQLYMMLFVSSLIFSPTYLNPETLPLILQAILYIFPLAFAQPQVFDITMKGLPLDLIVYLSLMILCAVYVFLAYIIFLFKKVEV